MFPLFDVGAPASYPLSATTPIVYALFLILNYVINIGLGWFLLKLANFDFAAGRGRFLKLFAISTFLVFVVEVPFAILPPINYAVAVIVLTVVYCTVFRKLGLSLKRAFAYSLIFAVLTNPIIGDFTLSATGYTAEYGYHRGPSDASSIIPDLVNKVYQRGVAIEVKENVKFKEDMTRSGVSYNDPIILSNINFVCAESAFCSASGAPLTVTDNRVVVRYAEQNPSEIAVCSGDGKKFYVCISKSTTLAENECKTKCGLP